MNFRFILLTICLIAASFFLYAGRPYSLTSDIGYQAFSARQYMQHEVSGINSIRLVSPRDLSKDVQFYLTWWTPCWTYLFVMAYKTGLAPGPAGRMLAVLLSVSGAIGWVWVTSILNMKGLWRVAGVTLAALYCLRTSVVYNLGTGDLAIYAVAPWLLGASILLGVQLRSRLDRRIVVQTTLLCLGLGCVYWLKYSGIFMSVAVLCALLIEQLCVRPRPRLAVLLAVMASYGTAFVLPILANKVYNYTHTGTDLIESSVSNAPPRTLYRTRMALIETLYYSSTQWFSSKAGVDRIAGSMPPSGTTPEGTVMGTGTGTYQWLIRVPGFCLFGIVLYLMRWYPSAYLRNLAALLIIIPLVSYPALSIVSSLVITSAIERCCAPFWILLELLIFVLLSQPLRDTGAAFRNARNARNARVALAIAAGFYLVCFLWIPLVAIRDCLAIRKLPAYQTSAAELWVADLSRRGTRDIDAQIKSLIRSPEDVIVPAVYSERSFGMDIWIELGGRLLPLTRHLGPTMRTHGHEGANYFGTTPFLTSRPLRVILVASDIYSRPQFPEYVQRIKDRFKQAGQWTRGPLDPAGRLQIWVADLQ